MTQTPHPARTGGSMLMELIKIVLAFFLPPLAVLLEVGLGTQFWINLILTILGWIPGVIHALIVVLRRG